MQRRHKVVVAGLALLVIGLLLSCWASMYLARSAPATGALSPYPPLDYARFTDPARRANYEEVFRRTGAFNDSYARAFGSCDDELAAAWKALPGQYSDTIDRLIVHSAGLRREVFSYYAAHDLTPFIDSAAVAGAVVPIPKIVYVNNLYKIACLDIIARHRLGKVAEATAGLEALLALNRRLLGTGRLLQEMVAIACLRTITDAMREMYPLDGQLPPPPALIGLAARLDAIDSGLRHALEPALACEALELEVNLSELNAQQNFGFDQARLRQLVRDEYSRLIFLSSRDIWTIGAELRQSPEDRLNTWERMAHPVTGTVFATLMPNLSGVLVKKEEARGRLRLVRLQLYLALYQQRHARLPDALAQLYAEFNLAPVINPLTGNEYPYPGIIAGDRVDVDYAEAKIVNNELVP